MRGRPDRLFLFISALLAVLIVPATAPAHLVTTGMGPVYDGIGHLLLTLEDLVPVLALAMYCGLSGPQAGRYLVLVLPFCWFIGGFAGLSAELTVTFPVQALSFLLLGLMISADLRLPATVFAATAALIGLIHGFINGIALQSGPAILGLLGIMAALFVLVSLMTAAVLSLRIPWTRIVVRVLGSWVAASGMLMIGWFIKG